MEQYSKEVLDHFYNPRNVGELTDADAVGEVGNIRCGDVMYIYLKIGKRKKSQSNKAELIDEIAGLSDKRKGSLRSQATTFGMTDKNETEEYIEDIKFKTLGCAAAIASTSMMTEMVKGKSLDEAMAVTRDDINEALGILPKQKYHCSILSADGIHKAIEEYKKK